ncbi:unnamed protein product [Somion occarium]|uniref:CHAT domain-containing protein n=1 Tax=Somion occarium TaxID=3059160 RepID=A0ABP1DW82_9APHY
MCEASYLPSAIRQPIVFVIMSLHYQFLDGGCATPEDRERIVKILSDEFALYSRPTHTNSEPSSDVEGYQGAFHFLQLTHLLQNKDTQPPLRSTMHTSGTIDPHDFAYYNCLLFRGFILKLTFMEESGEWDMLDEAIEIFSEGARDCPSDHPAYLFFLKNGFDSTRVRLLSFPNEKPEQGNQEISQDIGIFIDMFGRLSHADEEPQNKSVYEQVSLFPPESVLSFYELWPLSLRSIAERAGGDLTFHARTLDKAISQTWTTLVERPWHDDLHLILSQLHKWRFRFFRDEEDAKLWRDLLITYSEGHLWPVEKTLLRGYQTELYIEPQTPFHDLSEALGILLEDLQDTSQPIPSRIRTTMRFINEIEHSGTKNMDASCEVAYYLSEAVQLLPGASNFGQDVRTRLEISRSAQDLVNRAACFVLFTDEPLPAVRLLEQGRSTFWTKAMQLRTMKSALLPDSLQKSLDFLSNELEERIYTHNKRYQDRGAMKLDVGKEYAYRQYLRVQLEKKLDEIRTLPGMEDFITQEDFDSELAAEVSKDGPVVMLVASSHSCAAITLISPGNVVHVPLLDVTEDSLKAVRWFIGGIQSDVENHTISDEPRHFSVPLDILRAEDDFDSAEAVVDDGPDRYGRPKGKAKSDKDYRWVAYAFLWNSVVRPVIESLGLGKSGGRNRPRLWWCPTGAFSLLPIHAAFVPGKVSCSDYIVSSYTPSLRALLNARRAFQPIDRSSCRILLGAVPRPIYGSSLPSTVEEILGISDVVPAELILPIPPEDSVFSDSVTNGLSASTFLSQLADTTVLHLACHGRQNLDNPLESGFVLRDKFVTISELMPITSHGAFLAFLSACETARGSGGQPDEAAHLAATMLFAGFKSVIGTMWPMDDMDGPDIAEGVYHDAVQRLRSSGVSDERWAPYIHFGI